MDEGDVRDALSDLSNTIAGYVFRVWEEPKQLAKIIPSLVRRWWT